MKLKNLSQETLERVQEIKVSRGRVKLMIIPEKVQYLEDQSYGDNIGTVRYSAFIKEPKNGEFRDKDIPYLRKCVKVMKYINNTRHINSFKMLVGMLNKNKGEFSIEIIPYPDDISNDRQKEMKKFVNKL